MTTLTAAHPQSVIDTIVTTHYQTWIIFPMLVTVIVIIIAIFEMGQHAEYYRLARDENGWYIRDNAGNRLTSYRQYADEAEDDLDRLI